MLAEPVPRPVQTPGCKGRSPRQNKLIVSPFPQGRALCERGRGAILPLRGRGQKSKLQAGAAGDQEGKPPPGYHSGRGCRCRKRSDAGAPGAKPPAKLTYSPPFPPGRGSGVYPSPSGKGGRKASYRQGWQAIKRARPPPGYYSGRGCQCRKRSDAGAPGAEPLAKKLIVSPFPGGEGGAGVYPSPSGKGGRKAN